MWQERAAGLHTLTSAYLTHPKTAARGTSTTSANINFSINSEEVRVPGSDSGESLHRERVPSRGFVGTVKRGKRDKRTSGY